jgi:hypothetical protein
MTRNNLSNCAPCDAEYWCNGGTRQLLCWGDPSTCLGAAGCADGYGREGCSACEAGYREAQRTPPAPGQRPSLQCEKCPNDFWKVVLGAVLGVAALSGLYFACLCQNWLELKKNFPCLQYTYRCCLRQKHLVFQHSAFLSIPSRMLQGLSILYAAKSLPYPKEFRDKVLGFLNGLPIPWHVDCLKQNASWTFSDSFILRTALPWVVIFLIPIDLALLVHDFNIEDAEKDDRKDAGVTLSDGGGLGTGGLPPLVLARVSFYFKEVLPAEYPRWFVNYPQGTARGYDHNLYSTQFLSYSLNNLLPFALMALVCDTSPNGQRVLFYDQDLPCDIGGPYQGYAVFFLLFYALSFLWYYAVPLLASGALGSGWCQPVAAFCLESMKRAWCSRDDKTIQEREDPARIPKLPSLEPTAASFSFLQQLFSILKSLAVLWPNNNNAVVAVLLSLSSLELALCLIFLVSKSRVQWDFSPFVLGGELAIYIFYLALSIITHGIGLRCASLSCKPDAPEWEPHGKALLALYILFFMAFAALLLRLVVWDHKKTSKCAGCEVASVSVSGAQANAQQAPAGGAWPGWTVFRAVQPAPANHLPGQVPLGGHGGPLAPVP